MTIPQAGTAFLDRKYVPQELLTQRAAALSLQIEAPEKCLHSVSRL